MEENDLHYRIIAAAALGGLGGFLLARYLFGEQHRDKNISEHLATLSKLFEQIEAINIEDENLKIRIENILETIESTYGNPEE